MLHCVKSHVHVYSENCKYLYFNVTKGKQKAMMSESTGSHDKKGIYFQNCSHCPSNIRNKAQLQIISYDTFEQIGDAKTIQKRGVATVLFKIKTSYDISICWWWWKNEWEKFQNKFIRIEVLLYFYRTLFAHTIEMGKIVLNNFSMMFMK